MGALKHEKSHVDGFIFTNILFRLLRTFINCLISFNLKIIGEIHTSLYQIVHRQQWGRVRKDS